jgi:energy-coupling factor transporter ATP-binding protein EcfA2
MRIKKLKAKSVRGLPRSWPDLEIGDKGLVVYGPNGVGKSSIVDALEFALTQRSTLFSENRLGVSWDAAASHVTDGAPDIVVEAVEGSSTYQIEPQRTAASEPPLTQWLNAAGTASFVLRRHMLLRFITEQPRDRYTLLEPFFNLGRFQDAEAALRQWSDTLQTQRAAQAGIISRYEQTFRQTFAVPAGTPLSKALLFERLNNVLNQAGVSAARDSEQLPTLRAAITTALGGKERSQRLASLGALRTQAQRLGRLADHQQSIEAFQDALSALEAELSGRTHDVLIDLLVEGKRVIEGAGLDACPLCEQPIERDVLLSRIMARLDADAKVQTARSLVSQRRKALERPMADLLSAMGAFRTEAVKFVTLPSAYADTESLIRDIVKAVDDPNVTNARMQEFLERSKSAVATHEDVIRDVDTLIESEGGGEQRTRLESAGAMTDLLQTDFATYSKAVSADQQLSEERTVVDRLLAHAIEARRGAVQAALGTVSATANSFYETIHPKEKIATSQLQVRQVGQGSVNLSTNFYGKDEPPMLHLSESHLDTLGLCYFLAIRKHEAQKNTAFKVLVLDDVMHSVDADHRVRVAQLLRQEFADHQIVVATHDRHFYDALRKALGSAGYEYQAIMGWDIKRGPILGDPSTDLDCVVDPTKRASMRHEDLSAATGRFFEWLLKRLTERLQVAVPARFTRGHDIGSLWPPTLAKLRRQKGFKAAHPDLADNLDATGWVRNACGAHDNAPESSITPEEVREFAGLVAALHAATYCDSCGSFVAKQPNDDWSCDCGAVRHPDRPAASSSAQSPTRN